MSRELICIMCPRGCGLHVETEQEKVTRVTGNHCKKGQEYAVTEVTNPRRNIATSVLVLNGEMPLASVRLSAPIAKKDIFAAMEQIKNIRVEAPVTIGQVVMPHILGSDADVIITRDVNKKSCGRAAAEL